MALFKISDGNVKELFNCKEFGLCNWKDSALALADTESQALIMATQYDRGERQAINWACHCGKTHAILRPTVRN